MRSLPWPEMESSLAPGHTIRALLDYLCWVCRQLRQIGFHAGSDREEWCQRVQRAYTALFVPMIKGHGDPYPPDVPPARNPGIWPDIPSARVAGMTLRHQLTVMEMLAVGLRKLRWPHARPDEIAEWDRRIVAAHQALDHGEHQPMPDEARSEACKEALEEAEEADRVLRERARRRSQQLRKHKQLRSATAKERAAAPEKAAAKKAVPRKKAPPGKQAAAKKEPPARKQAATKKKAPARKKAAARKKAPTRKKAAAKKKKAPTRKKAAAKKKKAGKGKPRR